MPRRSQSRKQNEFHITASTIKFLPVVFAVLSFVGGFIGNLVSNTYKLSQNIATTPYVDKRHEEALKYTELKSQQTLQSAFDHSDANRQAVMIEFKAQGSDIKALGAKQDILLDSVKSIQQQLYDTRRR